MGSMPERESLSVLLVTADREFATACEQHLPALADIDITTTETVGGAIDVLVSSDRLDCIISDHNLPDTDGVAFLEAVRAQAPTLPFILFTSEGSEEVASRAISADVTEYLIKEYHSDQWDRLAALITDAVTYYRKHGNLIEPEHRAKTLLDAADDMIAVIRNGCIEYINKAGVNLAEVGTRDAVLGQPIDEVLLTENEFSLRDQLAVVQRREVTFDHEQRHLKRPDGERLPVELTATAAEWIGAPAAVLIIRDISDRTAHERDLRLKNRAMNKAPVGITIADANESDNPLIYVNEQFEQLTGYSADEVLGHNCRFLQGDGTDPEPVAEMREAIDADEPVTVELRNYRKDGTEFWNRVTIAPLRNDAGEVIHYVGFQEDVTERKEDERTLRRFERAIEAAGHAIYITDTNGTITYVNPAFERITGYESDEAIGRNPRILKSGEMSDDYYDRLWETLLDGDIWKEELVNHHQSGEPYHARQTIAPVTDESGAVEAFVAIQTDISEEKEREQQLRRYEHAIESTNDLIAAVDDDYRFLFANQAYREFYDLDEDEVTAKTLPEVVGAETWETIQPYVEQKFAGNYVHFEMTRSQPDQPERTFDIRYYPLEQVDDEILGTMAVMRDITDKRERERQLTSLDRMLRHTLHNELNIMMGRAELIAEHTAGDVAEWAEVILRVSERLLEQADKEREIVEFLSEPAPATVLDLHETVTDVVDRMESAHPEATINVDASKPLSLTTIPDLKRAIEELVENAIIHTDQAPPEVTIDVMARDETIEIKVSDNGPGIPDTERQVITEDAEIEPLLHSNGMGLWLVKRIVTRAGGRVQFEESDSRGSTVTLVVPYERSGDVKSASADA